MTWPDELHLQTSRSRDDNERVSTEMKREAMVNTRTGSAVSHRGRGVRVLVAAAMAASVGILPQAMGVAQAAPAAVRVPPAMAAITAHDGKFWAGTNPIKLRGLNIIPPCCSVTWFD